MIPKGPKRFKTVSNDPTPSQTIPNDHKMF